MYIGVDVGGTKTLVAVLTDVGKIVEETKFPTPKEYSNWLLELRHVQAHLKHQEFKAGGVAMPGRIDREHGRVERLGNLTWTNIPVQADCEKIFSCPIVVENDANLAGLSEAMVHKKYHDVLYVTVSTGIGTGFVSNQVLVPSMLDAEGGHLMLPNADTLQKWESFASGRAMYEHFGRPASDIPASETEVWKYVAHNLALGFYELIALFQPDVIVIGGSIGTHFKKYQKFLKDELTTYKVPVVPIPPIVQAKRPEEAVVYGCYDLARQTFSHA